MKNFPQFVVIHTVKGFSVVNETEVDIFLEFSCFSVPQQMLAIWSLVPLPFLNPAWTSGSSWFTYCWSLDIEFCYFASVWEEYSCVVVWAFFGIAFLWDWSENWHFPLLWTLLSFPNLLAYWVQHLLGEPHTQYKKAKRYDSGKWAGFRKDRGTRDQIANIHWIIEKTVSTKTSVSLTILWSVPLTLWIVTNSGKFLKRWAY